MRALLCTELGRADKLQLGTAPDPEPGPGEVVIEVAVAALNFPDTLIIEPRHGRVTRAAGKP